MELRGRNFDPFAIYTSQRRYKAVKDLNIRLLSLLPLTRPWKELSRFFKESSRTVRIFIPKRKCFYNITSSVPLLAAELVHEVKIEAEAPPGK